MLHGRIAMMIFSETQHCNVVMDELRKDRRCKLPRVYERCLLNLLLEFSNDYCVQLTQPIVFVLVALPELKFKTLVPLQSPAAPIERGSSEAGKSGSIPSDVGPESSL